MITGSIYQGGTLDGVVQKVQSMPVQARALPPYSDPTAQWEDGTLVLGMPDAKLRVSSLTDTPLSAGNTVEAVGIPVYVDTPSQYSAYGITQKGWYIFARISAADGVAVSEETTVTGAAGVIATVGAEYVDVAVRFETAAVSAPVTVAWGEYTETFVFKATDLAVRNLDYRTTFYVYDAADYATWSYTPATGEALDVTQYFTVAQGKYVNAAVLANAAIPAGVYYTGSFALTQDATFAENKQYFTKINNGYYNADVTPGEAVTADTYYEGTFSPASGTFAGKRYYTRDGDTYTAAPLEGPLPINTVYYEDGYVLTADTTVQDGKTYYWYQDGQYVPAFTPGGTGVPIPQPNTTWYEAAKVITQDTVFIEDKTYYTLSGTTYSEASVTAGEPVPTVYYVHSKVTFSGMVRNITYKLDEPIDCAQEYILPEIEEDTHGAWFEIRLRHTGSFSSTLVVPTGVKVATEHTQAETAGMNMVDLHYSDVGGVKIWRFLNTHSSIPT